MLAPDALIAERYRLERELGAGGMGVVWSARQVVTRQAVALKFLRDPDSDPNTKKRFLREARAACAVRHANVVQIHDVIEADGMPIIVMEMLEGESLGAKLRRDKALSVEELARIMLPVVSAVGTAHSLGIVHRDLKPDNIFLTSDSTGVSVKVLDFGVAKLTASDGDAEKTAGLTSTGTMVGTPYYMSPEQAFGERDIDHRSDVWALGIIFYQCLTGKLPTRGENVGQVLKIIIADGIPPLSRAAPDLPADVAGLVDKMLARTREDRPADLREVQNVLRRYSDVPAGSFGSAVAPPRVEKPAEVDREEDEEAIARSSSAPATSAATPAARGAVPARRSMPAPPDAVTVLGETGAGVTKPAPTTARRRVRATTGFAAFAIAAGILGAAVMRGRSTAPSAAVAPPLPPTALVATAVPREAPGANTAPPTASAAEPTNLSAPSASAAKRPAPRPASQGAAVAKASASASTTAAPSAAAPAAPAPAPKSTTPDVFVNKPPF